MVAEILSTFGNEIDELSILPSSGGVYEVSKGNTLIFSKKQLGRFPTSDHEVIQLLK